MECIYCGEKDESQLLESSSLMSGRLETVDICLKCFWSGKHKTKNGNILSKSKPIKRTESAGNLPTGT